MYSFVAIVKRFEQLWLKERYTYKTFIVIVIIINYYIA